MSTNSSQGADATAGLFLERRRGGPLVPPTGMWEQAGRKPQARWRAAGDGQVWSFGIELDPAADELRVEAEATIVAGSDISGIGWTLPVLPLQQGQLLLPADGGIAIASDTLFWSSSFQYPFQWQANMLLFQGSAGGLLVYADHPRPVFEDCRLQRHLDSFHWGRMDEIYLENRNARIMSAETVHI